MANEQNLKPPLNKRSRREHHDISVKGAIASNKVQAERKTMKQQLEMLMTMPVTLDNIRDSLNRLGLPTDAMTNQMAINVALFQQALKGNTKAYELVRDALGEKPIEQVQIQNVDTTWFVGGKKNAKDK